MNKLFAVRVVTYSVVLAADAASAQDLADDCGSQLIDECIPSSITVEGEISKLDDLPGYWTPFEFAYGGDGEECIGDILAAMPTPDTKTIDMFAQVAP